MPAEFVKCVIMKICKVCNNPAAKIHKAVECKSCELSVHIKCNKINTQRYKYFQKESCA